MCAARVIRGPWPEGGPGRDRPPDPPPDPPPKVRRTPRGPLPQRIRVGRFGPTVLMPCCECLRPFAPDQPVPRDRLCRECRPRIVAQLALFDVEGEPTPEGEIP